MTKVTNELSKDYFSKLNVGYDKWFKKPFSSYVRSKQFRKFLLFAEGCEKYLEVGCGTGQFISRVNCPERIGVDISEKMVRLCWEKIPDAKFYVAAGHRLPFKNQSFDCVVMPNVFQYLENPEEVIRELIRVTSRGGKILFTVFTKTSLSMNPVRFFIRRIFFKENVPVVKFYNPGQIRKMLKDRHFTIEGSAIRPPLESRWLYQNFWHRVECYEHEKGASPYLSTEMFVTIDV